MKKGVILTAGLLAINIIIMPMMTGMRRGTTAFTRTAGTPAFGAMAPGMLGGTNNAVDTSNQPTGIPASSVPAPIYNPTQYFNPDNSPVVASKIGQRQAQQFTPKIDFNADTTNLVNNLQQPNTAEFKVHIATRGAAGAIYGQPMQIQRPNKAMQLLQKRDFSVAGFKEMLAATMTPELEKKYNLGVYKDGTYEPYWIRLIQDGHLAIVKSFLQANLVLDTSDLLTKAIEYCNPNDLHDILMFYHNDIETINQAFKKILNSAKHRSIDLSIDTITQLVQAGMSHDLKIQASLDAAEMSKYAFTKALNPGWFAQEFTHQKNSMLQAPDLSQEQKNMLKNMYDTATINNGIQSATYQLPEQTIRQIAQSELTFSQIKKYVPMQLFDTKKIFDLKNTTITAQLLLKADPYLMKNMHHETDVSKHNAKTQEQILLQSGFYDKIITVEQKMELENYHTFVTGRNWKFNFAQDMWNLIKAVKSGASYMENIVELTPGKYENNIQNHAIKVQEHLEQRKTILQSGSQSLEDGNCLNSTLFENNKNHGICTSHYIVKNISMTFTGHSPKDIFKQFGILDKYPKYEQEINQLEQLHQESSKLGELLAVSIHKDKIDHLTYISSSGRKKYFDTKQEMKECKPSAMLEKLYSDAKTTLPLTSRPQEYYYYLAAPGIPGELGRDYKVQSIHVADPEKFAQYKQGVAQLFEKLKKDLALPAQDDSQFALFEDYCTEFFNFHQQDLGLYEID